MASVSDAKLVAMWEEVLRLCDLGHEESVVILVKPESNPRNVQAAGTAAGLIGARVLRLMPVIDDKPLHEIGPAMEALRHADMVIDLLGVHLLRHGEQEALKEAGTRVLYVTEPPEMLDRMMPSENDKRRVLAASKCLKGAEVMRVTSEAGTDFSVRLGEYPVLEEYGYADEPGHWDHWPAGFIATWPNEKSASGTVVIDRGDIIFPFKTYVQTPIRLVIANGYVRDIEGGFDAEYLREYVGDFDDPEGYAVSHLGWGLQPKARWTALGIYKDKTNGNDGRAFYGNFMFSTGPNTDAGGARDTLCHLDIPMRNCSVHLDGEPMVIKGDVIPEDQRAPDMYSGAPGRRRSGEAGSVRSSAADE